MQVFVRKGLLAAGLIGLGGQAALAQATAPPPLPAAEFRRFYVGAGCTAGVYEVYYPRRVYDEGGLFPTLTGGYQLSPRLAAEASLSYDHHLYYSEVTLQRASGQTVRDSYRHDDHWVTAVPVLLRFTGTRRPEHRAQFDVLAGFTVVHGSYLQISEQYDDQQRVSLHEERAERTTGLAFSGGLSARYRLGRHLEAVGDAVLNRAFADHPQVAFRPTYALGLRYRFKNR